MEITKHIKMFSAAVLSAVVMSIGYGSFVFKAGFFPGGFSGLARLITEIGQRYLNLNLSFSILYFLMSFVSACLVFKTIGRKFTIYSMVQVIVFSYLSPKLPDIFFIEDILLMAVFGGIVQGIGISIALMNNLSAGGTDFLSIYFSTKHNKSTWNEMLLINIAIILTAGLTIGWEIALYSIIFQYCTNKIIQTFHKRYTHESLLIVTKMPKEVCDEIFNTLRHGITILNGEGGYKHENETLLYMVVNTYQTDYVVKAVKRVDPSAFINVMQTKKVVGNYYQQPLD